MGWTLLVLVRMIHIGSALMLFALPYFLFVILRPGWSEKRGESPDSFCQKMMTGLWVALVVEALSGGAWFWLVAAQMSGQSPWVVLPPADLKMVLCQTPFGRLWLLRWAIGVALGVALYFVSQGRPRLSSTHSLPTPLFGLNLLLLALSGCLLITLAGAGHAAAGMPHHLLYLLADLPHLLVGAIWPAGLIPFGCFLWHLKRGNPMLPAGREIGVLRRFSQSSFIAVLILLVSGSIIGCLAIGSWANLRTTPSGWLLLGKVFVVFLMIGMGAFNRLQLLPRIHEMPLLFCTLRRTVLAESCLALVVLLIVGMHIHTPASLPRKAVCALFDGRRF